LKAKPAISLPYGDYDGLAARLRDVSRTGSFIANAIADVQARWGWKDKVAQYAAIYDRVYAAYYQDRPPSA
jgi:hypothetical protein